MPEPPMSIPLDQFSVIENNIQSTIEQGTKIRNLLAKHSNTGPYNAEWEVEAAVEALHVFASRWTIEILATLYITGPRRFNEMKNMLSGISSRIELEFLFGNKKRKVKSAAAARLFNNSPLGILAIGNSNPNYYNSILDTIFFSHVTKVLNGLIPKMFPRL